MTFLPFLALHLTHTDTQYPAVTQFKLPSLGFKRWYTLSYLYLSLHLWTVHCCCSYLTHRTFHTIGIKHKPLRNDLIKLDTNCLSETSRVLHWNQRPMAAVLFNSSCNLLRQAIISSHVTEETKWQIMFTESSYVFINSHMRAVCQFHGILYAAVGIHLQAGRATKQSVAWHRLWRHFVRPHFVNWSDLLTLPVYSPFCKWLIPNPRTTNCLPFTEN